MNTSSGAFFTSHAGYRKAWDRAASLEQEARSVPRDVHTLSVLGGVDVVVFHADVPALVVIADRREDLPKILTEYANGRLTVQLEPHSTVCVGGSRVSADGSSIASLGDINIGIQQNFYGMISGGMQARRGIIVNGAVVRGGVAGHFLVGLALPGAPPTIDVQGSGDVVLFDVDLESLTISISGSGDVTAHGQAGHLNAQVTGSGDIDADGLKADSALLAVVGSGGITARVYGPTNASVTGSGDIELRGQPEPCHKTVIGSGDIDIL